MRRPASLPLLVALAALALGFVEASAQETTFKVIVHPTNDVESVSRDFLRRAYLKKGNEWDSGEAIHPVDLSSRFAVRDRFTQEILKKTPAQLRNYWNQQIFSGKGSPPSEMDATRDVIAFVLEHPGAVGYLPADVDPGGTRVIEVR
jgi:ABC-type phosphate transport system substrate-binding protein